MLTLCNSESSAHQIGVPPVGISNFPLNCVSSSMNLSHFERPPHISLLVSATLLNSIAYLMVFPDCSMPWPPRHFSLHRFICPLNLAVHLGPGH